MSRGFPFGLLLTIAAYFQTPRFARLALRRRHSYLQNAVIKDCLGVLCVDALWHRNAPIEFSVAAFAAIVTFALFFVFVLALAFDRDAIIGQFHFHVVLGQARQVRAQYELIVALEHFN